MPKFKFSKLVRDNIVNDQLASGAKPVYHVLSPHEHKLELIKKIIEETKELTDASQKEFAAELADVQQAIDDLRELQGLSNDELRRIQAIKRNKKGAFKKGLFIDYLEIAEDDPWVEHYRRHADRYPEVKKS